MFISIDLSIRQKKIHLLLFIDDGKLESGHKRPILPPAGHAATVHTRICLHNFALSVTYY
jgi:hypothetical protein